MPIYLPNFITLQLLQYLKVWMNQSSVIQPKLKSSVADAPSNTYHMLPGQLSPAKGTFFYPLLPIMSNEMVLMLYHLSVTKRSVHHYWLERANWLGGCCKLGDLEPAFFIVTWWLLNGVVRGGMSVVTINKGNKYNLAHGGAVDRIHVSDGFRVITGVGKISCDERYKKKWQDICSMYLGSVLAKTNVVDD